MKLKDALDSEVDFEKFDEKDPKTNEITTKIYGSKLKGVTDIFEIEVFNNLLANKKILGIKNIYRFKNLIIDGFLILDDDTGVLLEIKYALNWVNSCQARMQFQRYIIEKRNPNKKLQLSENFLIIFNHFSSDWGRYAKKRENINGWTKFYSEEEKIGKELTPTRIIQNKEGKLRAFIDKREVDLLRH